MSYEIGSKWRRWDLHFHTPASCDYGNQSVTAVDIVHALTAAHVGVVAITDHHTMNVDLMRELMHLAEGKMTVLPGIELRSELGGKPIHYTGLFPEDCELGHVWDRLKGALNLTADGIEEQGGNEKVYVPITKGAELVRELGGLVSIHAGTKTNSIEEIRNTEQFQQRIKYDITKAYVDLMEIGQLKDVAVHHEKIFPTINLERPLIVGSDNHDATAYEMPTPCWIKADPTFRGLRMAIREPRRRFFLGDRPPQLDLVGEKKTKYIRSIRFTKKPDLPAGENWFDGSIIDFNPGLVAIIGNKGSGKSALTDCLGLLGSCTTSESFSFLDENRFRHPKTGRAGQFETTIQWRDGEQRTRSLDDDIESDEVERVKYLPQKHVENICDELTGPGGGRFERELKKVIFAHVPMGDRLGTTSLDELIRFKTQEVQKKVEALAARLRELCTQRAQLERQLDPSVRQTLKNGIEQRKREISTHDGAKPKEVKAPGLDATSPAEAKEQLDRVAKRRAEREQLAADVIQHEQIVGAQQLRGAQAEKLLRKLENLEEAIKQQIGDLDPEASQLGLVPAELVTYSIDRSAVEAIHNVAADKVRAATAKLNAEADGLKAKLDAAEAALRAAQDELDRPNREYQAYLETLAKWEAKRQALVGDSDDPDSLRGLEAHLEALDAVPANIESVTKAQSGIAAQIHASRKAEADVYRTLYRPVQSFIENHELAKDQLNLEFKAEIVEEGFVDGLLSYLNQARKGSFYGAEEGRNYAKSLVQTVDWSSTEAVTEFLSSVERALQWDVRDNAKSGLKDQIRKGRAVADVLAWLYELTYLKPRYLLRWEGKDVGQLSPGERGTLLLVFYLLIDDSDMPLIIDQPEANLDNQTVALKLVDCIRAASERRQVVIVTHNPNLAVVCDADQIIHCSLDKLDGNRITYTPGALENPVMNRFAIDVLEGSRPAFDKRGDTYEVGNP